MDWQSIAEQRAAELALINSVGQGLARELDFQAIIDLVGDKIREILDAQVLSIRLVDRATNLIHFPYAFEQGERVQIDPVPLGAGFSDHVLRTRQPLVINQDIEQRTAEFGSYTLPGTVSSQSFVGVPILAGDQAIGVINLEHEREQAFSDSAVNLLITLAANLGVALQNARLFDETRRLLKETDQRASELAVINSVQQGLASQLDFQAIIDLVGDKIRDIFDAQAVLITLYDQQARLIHHRYLIERGQRFVFEAPLPVDRFRQRVIESRQPWLISQDYEQVASELGEEPVLTGDVPKSLLFVPMIIGSEVTGVISLQNLDREHAFSDPDVRLLTTIAASMSVALENARLFDETKRLLKETGQRAAELAIINSVQQGFASKLDVQAICDLVGDKIQEVFDAQAVAIATLDHATGMKHIRYGIEKGVHFHPEPMPYGGVARRLIQTRQPVLLRTMRDPHLALGAIVPGTQEVQSAVFVPLIVGENVTGYITLQNVDREDAFSESDVRLLQTLASSMGVALENARLFDETQRLLKETEQRNAELAIINSVQQALASKLDLASIYELIGQKVREVFKVDVVDIVIYDPVSHMLTMPYSYEKGDRTVMTPRPSYGVRQHIIETRQPMLINRDWEKVERAFNNPVITGARPKAALFVPLLVEDKVRGIISIQDLEHEDVFTEMDVRLLTTLTNAMSVALENARLFDETQRLLKETEQRNAELAIINSVQQGLASKLDMQAIYDLVGDKLCEVFDSQDLDIRLYDPTTQLISFPYVIDHGQRLNPAPMPLAGFSKYVVETRQTLAVNDRVPDQMTRFGSFVLPGTDVEKSFLAVPILIGERAVGLVFIADYQKENAFDETDVRLLQTVVAAMSVALENARLFDETKRLLRETDQRAAELALINSVQEGLASKLDVQAIYDLVGDKIQGIFDAQAVTIATLDQATGMGHIRYGIEKGVHFQPEPAPYGSVAQQIIQTHQPVLIRSAREQAVEAGTAPIPGTGETQSAAVVPLIVGENVTGYVSLQNVDREDAFSESDVRLLQTLASSMSVALENARLFHETDRRAAELALINSVQQGLAAQLDVNAIFDLVGNKVHDIFEAQVVVIATYDRQTDLVNYPYMIEDGERLVSEPLPLSGGGFAPHIIRTREPLLINADVAQRMIDYGATPVGQGNPVRSYLGVPLIIGGEARGIISLQNTRRENAFSESDLRLLGTLASAMGVALENARLFDETQRRASEMAALTEIGREISATLDLNTVLERIATRAQDVLNASDVVVRLLEPDGSLPTVVALGQHSDIFKQDVITLGHGITGHVAQTGVAEIVNFPLQDLRIQHVPGTEQDEEHEAIIFAPLILRDRVIGVMVLWRDREAHGPFTPSDLDFSVGLARQAAIAIANARLFNEVQRQQQYSDALVRHSPVAILATDPALNVVTWNPAAEKLFGYAAAQAIGRHLDELIANDPGIRADAVSYSQKMASEGRIHAITRRMRQDGTLVDVEFWTLPVVVAGEEVGYIALYHDLTEIKLAEEALQESHRQLADIINFMPDSVLVIDREGKVIAWNRAMEEMTGTKAQEILGKGNYEYALPFYGERRPILIDLVTVPQQEMERKYVQIKREGQVLVGETYVPHLKGGGVYLLGTASALHDSKGNIVGSIEIIRDLTERKHMEEALHQAKEDAEAATQAKSAFLAMMSHEIRTPMNAIIGMSGLLLDTPLNDEQREFATIIRDSGDALLTIINDILDYSKIEAGKMELENQPFDLRECVEGALDLVTARAVDKGLELAYVLDEQAPTTLVGDVTRLRQVLLNLLSNSLKFTESGEVVVLVEAKKKDEGGGTLARDEERSGLLHPSSFILHFSVRDTGIGIPPDRMDRIFRSFSQIDASTARKYGGTGLGLAISKRLSEMMGGTIWAESDGVPGHGATFHFTIRAEAAATPGTLLVTHRDLRGAQSQLEGRRVLIVDDNDTNRRILTLQTQKWGMLPRDTASPLEALDWIRSGDPFDVAIVDMRMPDMDGLALATEIRKHRDAHALPLMLFTSLGRREMGADAIGFAAHLTKPIKPSQLLDALMGLFADQPIRVEKPSPRKVQIDPGMARGHPLRILVTDDNAVNQKLVLRLLKQMGYRGDVAANGLEAIAAVERQPYDVILMDVQMPEMDGLEASRRIVARWPREKRPRIIAMTANAMQGDREMCLAAGMDDYITKPLRVEGLVGALSRTPARRDEGGKMDMPEPVIDTATLDNLIATTDAQFVSELIDTFLEDSRQLMATMRQAVREDNAEDFRRAAHSLKSNSNNLGALNLAALSKDLELAGKAGQLEGASDKVEQLAAEYAQVERALREWQSQI